MGLLKRARALVARRSFERHVDELRREIRSLREAPAKQLRQLLEAHDRRLAETTGRQLKTLEKLRLAVKEVQEQIRRVERRQEAILRQLYLTDMPMEAPYAFTAQRFRSFSQNGEDGLSLAVFKRIGVGTGRFVDIGCGTKGGNARFFAEEFGWSGLLIDAREHAARLGDLFPPGKVHALSVWISRENVNDILRDRGFAGEIDLLSIDVDGVDYWLWEALTVASPRLVIVEYNSLFGPYLTVTVPYEQDFNRKRRDVRYHGASLAALVMLAKKKGYRLVAVEPAGINAYFVRNDLAPDMPGFEAHEIFRRFSGHQAQITRMKFDVAQFTPENGLPLIDVAAESSDGPAIWRPNVASSAGQPA